MRCRPVLPFILAVLACACGGSDTTAPVPPATPVPLKDVVVDFLPAPYYHFEYDAKGRVSAVSFASGFTSYEVIYDRGRIAQMKNNTLGNMDRLVYFYDNAGRVDMVIYLDSNGVIYRRLAFSYDGTRLTGIQWELRVESGFFTDKSMSFSYDTDGNLLELTEHRPPANGSPETTTVDHFEQYDDGTNVDAFGLIHDDFFDHLVLLPDVQLQRGNPGKAIHTGDGDNFEIDYVYSYDGEHRPLSKNGDLVFLTGPHAGQRFQTRTVFSYY